MGNTELRESLSDSIMDICPTDTPFMASVAKRRAAMHEDINAMMRDSLDSLNLKPRYEWRTDYLGSSTPVVMPLQDKLLLLLEE